MNNLFIPYEQALKLKELGFDEPCLGYYTHNEKLCKYGSVNNGVDFQTCTHNEIYNTYSLAPTFSQAFKFFREKRTLYHQVNMFGAWDKPQFSYIVSGPTMTHPAHMWHYENANSYEEAELQCLNKLIEITLKQK